MYAGEEMRIIIIIISQPDFSVMIDNILSQE